MTETAGVLDGLEPAPFWAHFATLTTIPRPSRAEGPVIEHVRAWAASHGYELQQDAGRNVVIRVPASPGRESAPTLVLQGHLDMVCEREPSSPNDPAEGRIELVRDGDWLKADGTTLGADDGVAIAAMMALVEDDSIEHGPLELLMTVAEEVGLEGANALDGSLLTGSTLINLDSEEDGVLTVGCAGSTDTWIRVDAPRESCAPNAITFTLAASGGLGGHSGSQIHLGRANAIKVLGRVLREAHAAAPFRLVSLNGGKSRNAIPRDAEAVCSVPGGQEDAFRTAAESALATVRDAYAKTDPGATVTIETAGEAADAWTEEATATLLDVVALGADRSARHEPRLRGARRDEHVARRGGDGGRAAHAAQPVAVFQRLGASGSRRDARCRRAPRPRRSRGQAQLQGVAPGPRITRAGRGADGVRAALRRAAEGLRRARGPRDGGHRHEGLRAAGHARPGPAVGVATLARRAR